ncbi:MAG: dioxygenase [Pseudomonadota bacterium]|nr:dioxygenase [Pseudomonadota bacterium]
MKPAALPPVFLSHGSPMIALEPGAAGAFMRELGPAIDAAFGRPRAILVASAHTAARMPVLLAASTHAAVYDFGGFDRRLNALRYDAAGAPEVAQRAAELLAAAGLDVPTVAQGGLDHGIWTVLRYLYPGADVPVVPLAFAPHQSPAQQFALGAALAPLAEEGVLLMGSGSITHNLRRAFASGAGSRPEDPQSMAFREWFRRESDARAWEALLDYRRRAPHAVDMHPTDEHLLPWFIAAGAGGAADPAVRLHASAEMGSIGMDAYAFGVAAPTLAGQLAQARARPGVTA